MLVLGRNFGQKVVIRVPAGKERIIEIMNCDYRNRGRMKVGIQADPDIEIYRDELGERRNARK